MVSGEEIDIIINEEYRAGQGAPRNKEEIYSAMIVLGFLSYYAFIVELKKDEDPEVAINQIKEKEYVEKFKKENNHRLILAVAICYDSKTKEHHCKIEELR